MEIGGGDSFIPHPSRRARALVVGCGTLQRSCLCRCGGLPCLLFVAALAKCSTKQKTPLHATHGGDTHTALQNEEAVTV